MARLCLGAMLAVLASIAAVSLAYATPLVPTDDNQVIEVLPSAAASRLEDRRWRKLAAARPGDVHLAVTLARRDLEAARTGGDPRFAGQALAALDYWHDLSSAPSDVLVARANVLQFLHDFDGAGDLLKRVLARPAEPAQTRAQASLTLATVLRVQGKYAESDAACGQVLRAGASEYGRACLAENAGLRGEYDAAFQTLDELLADADLVVSARAWLLTTRAELAQRAGRALDAENAFAQALALQPDAYTAVSYADFLVDRHFPSKVFDVLAPYPRTDAVLLRLAIAGAQTGGPSARRDIDEMRARFEAERARPGAYALHAREEAMFALWVERSPTTATRLAEADVARQREPVDLLVYARAAAEEHNQSALAQARQVADSIGLRDRRLDAFR